MNNKIQSLDLKKQYELIKNDIDNAIFSVIDKSAYIQGEFVNKFESNFALFQEAEYCIGVGNGTDALEIAIESLGLASGSEIIVPANSFIASSEAVTRAGYNVVFCDVNEGDFTININDLEKRITKKTSAIIAVHLYGHPCDMDALNKLANLHSLKIIEDCAQAHAAEYKGKRVGAIGDIGTFSFYPGKNLGAFGDGGAIITNNSGLAKKCRMLANHGRISKYNHEFEGRNSRLDGIQAAILDVKLKHLDGWTNRRIEIAALYKKTLKECSSIKLPVCQKYSKHVYHLFVIRTKSRDLLKNPLSSHNIESGIHYPIALPKLKAYEYLGQGNENGLAWTTDSQLLSLPIGEHLANSQIETISDVINSFCD